MAIRRDRDPMNLLHLPAAGREGDPPAWPLTRATLREKALWAEEWRRPQGVAWEMSGLELEVALYVRNVVDAERRGASATTRRLVLSQMDRLGITVAGMTKNGWDIADDAGDARPEPQQDQPKGGRSAGKDRLLELVVNQ
jgi:hypothetical protein